MSDEIYCGPECIVIGAGPSGLFSAWRIASAGIRVEVFERNRGAARKFLIAGRGGLNLTHSEPLGDFAQRYQGGKQYAGWLDLLTEFSPQQLRDWAAMLGSETFVGTSGRVFPMEMSAGRLLAAWLRELRTVGVVFNFSKRLCALQRDRAFWLVSFDSDRGRITLKTRAVLLALGGCSWPQTGSDGGWVSLIRHHRVSLEPFEPANCGWRVRWPQKFLEVAEGQPLKNIRAYLNDSVEKGVPGDLIITKTGIEGGPIYRLGPRLRRMAEPSLRLDLKPDWPVERIKSLLEGNGLSFSSKNISRKLRLCAAAEALLRLGPQAIFEGPTEQWEHVKAYPLRLEGPCAIERAISTAGGVSFDCLNECFMAKEATGLFFAGEMLDWEAPTGGYLLQGCFSTAARAAKGVIQFLSVGGR